MENPHDGGADANDTPLASPSKVEMGPEEGSLGPHSDHDADDEAEVWQSFEQSVAYMRNLSDLYKDAFLMKKTTVPTVAHIHAAKDHAREALELLASNLLNASTAIVASMENQEDQVAAVGKRLDRVKGRLGELRDARDQEILRRFFEPSNDNGPNELPVAVPVANRNDSASLQLALAGPASSASASPSPYLFL